MNAIDSLIYKYDFWIVSTFGYDLAVRIEDIVYGLSMIFVGILIASICNGAFLRRLRSLKDFGDSQVKLLRVDNGRKSTQMIQIRTFKEAVEQSILLSFSPLFTFKRFTKRDERRTRRFVRIMFIAGIVILIWGIFTTLTVLRPV